MVRQHIYLLSREEIKNLDEIIISERNKGYVLVGLVQREELRPFVSNDNAFHITFIHKSNLDEK